MRLERYLLSTCYLKKYTGGTCVCVAVFSMRSVVAESKGLDYTHVIVVRFVK